MLGPVSSVELVGYQLTLSSSLSLLPEIDIASAYVVSCSAIVCPRVHRSSLQDPIAGHSCQCFVLLLPRSYSILRGGGVLLKFAYHALSVLEPLFLIFCQNSRMAEQQNSGIELQ